MLTVFDAIELHFIEAVYLPLLVYANRQETETGTLI